MITRLMAWLRGIVHRDRSYRELDEELQFHIEQETAAHVAHGVAPGEARRLALATLGGLTPTREATRRVRALGIDAIARDVRHGCRALAASPGFTAAALAVLALGIGAATAIFSVVDAVVLRALPFPQSHRLVAIGDRDLTAAPDAPASALTPQDYFDYRDRQDVFETMAAIAYGDLSLQREGPSDPETLRGWQVTSGFFAVLGVRPALGRAFTPDDEIRGQNWVAVISDGLWRRRYGGAPDVIGRRLPAQLGRDRVVVGVMPPGFEYPVSDREAVDVWVPYVAPAEARVRGTEIGRVLEAIGRLRDGVTVDAAQARMTQIAADLARQSPGWFENRAVEVEGLQRALTRQVRPWMLMLLGAAGCVMLIACANLSNLLLVRGSTREHELAVRSALGASRGDLIRTLLVESVILALAGAALGALAARIGVDAIRAALPAELPRAAAIDVDVRVLVVTMFAALVTGLVTGLAPVVQFANARLSPLGRQGRANTAAPRAGRLRGALIAAEIALAVVLLSGAGLFLSSFHRVASVDLGVDTDNVLSVRVRPLVTPDQPVAPAVARSRQAFDAIISRVRALSGVEAVALQSAGLPLRGDLITVGIQVPGRTLPRNEDIELGRISTDYFRALQMAVTKGRPFTDGDRPGDDAVVILNEAAARKYFVAGDPIGRYVEIEGRRRIVGIVADIRRDGPESDPRPQAYVPWTQSTVIGATLIIRTTSDPRAIVPAVKQIVWAEFPDLPIPDATTLEQYFDRLVAERRFNMMLFGIFGLIGVAIAGLGVYGVIAYAVARRTREFGIRMALGAPASTILTSVLSGAGRDVSIGLGVGLAGAWILGDLVRSFLFQIQPHDPWVLTGAAVLCTAAAVLAAALPARRASRVDPIRALRIE
ncbi:MAG TPA: ABC transporter permease [Vicinamibacterales bacterium]|nr:ABC transporter permease [Vicinamibacterales bacterium]